jgi:hypothetical protein
VTKSPHPQAAISVKRFANPAELGRSCVQLEVWNTVATVGTFLVILATAIAAIIQLQHLRVNNQLQALLAILRMPYDPELSSAFDFVLGDFAKRMRDPEFRSGLTQLTAPDRRIHKELRVCDYYERLGSCIKFGLIAEELYFDNSTPERFWNILEPGIALYRQNRGPTAYENFEYLVIRSNEWDRRHPNGNLPPGIQRLVLRHEEEAPPSP